MSQQQLPQEPGIINAFDPTLNPKNAGQKGYKYIDDIIYNESNPNASTKDILELINEHGHKLGSPSESKEINIYYGLYMPIKEK